MSTKATAQDRIHAAATAAGWRARTGGTPGASIVDYLQGTRRVTVYYGVRGQVISCSWQTGSTGGRQLTSTDPGKEARLLELLATPRWTVRREPAVTLEGARAQRLAYLRSL